MYSTLTSNCDFVYDIRKNNQPVLLCRSAYCTRSETSVLKEKSCFISSDNYNRQLAPSLLFLPCGHMILFLCCVHGLGEIWFIPRLLDGWIFIIIYHVEWMLVKYLFSLCVLFKLIVFLGIIYFDILMTSLYFKIFMQGRTQSVEFFDDFSLGIIKWYVGKLGSNTQWHNHFTTKPE